MYWKAARRDRALGIKASKLANVPCNSAPLVGHEFNLSTGATTVRKLAWSGLQLAQIASYHYLCHPVRSSSACFPAEAQNVTTARERNIGLNNRVIGGLLLHTWRDQDQQCEASGWVYRCRGGCSLKRGVGSSLLLIGSSNGLHRGQAHSNCEHLVVWCFVCS